MNTDNPNLTSQERRNNELELAKTAGSPAFFAPELCGINDDEISNTITQFAALLNSRTSNKSQPAFPRTPSNISSYSKLDAIFAPRSINTPSIMSRMSDGSLNKTNNDSKSIISQDDKSQTEMNDTTIINNNLPNDKSSYSSLLQPPSENNDKFDSINISEKQSTLSLSHQDLNNPPQKPRSIKWVQCPSKRSLSLSEGTNINVISKSSLDDKLNLTNNIVLNKSYSVRSNRSTSSNLHYSSNESLNIRRKIPDSHNAEIKTGYSSSYSTLDSNNRIRIEDGKHYLKVHSKSNLSINLDGSNETMDNNINTSNITYNINNCTSPTDYEKTIPSESPLFVRRRCSQSSSKSNKISRSQSSLSSKFNDPKKRVGMKEIENHPWVTEDMTKEERKEWLEFVSLNDDPLDVTEDEVKKALTLRERIKKGFSKFTHSFNFIGEFRRRTKITDKELLKQNQNKYNKSEVVDSTIRESKETISKSDSINNSTNTMTKNRSMSLGQYQINHSNLNSSHNIINYDSQSSIQSNNQENKLSHPDSALNVNSRNDSGSISNNIHILPGLKRRNTTNDETNNNINVRSSQIYTIPKTFLNKDLENTKDSDNNEEADINEDSSGEILYMSFDRKPKRKNTHIEFDNSDNDDDNGDGDKSKGVNFEI
ncbi:hypothetical protein PIROE2DRAFT_61216 [Piromyces sp. E2]|nr:hypothetical protein PIROE2DRAFT_61216 [Piromyces sp. E2]|eukprot:OUM63534.1 hypothetical protein PIROE2DRAFT_61216 [Piromyces sp. E2]